MSESDKMGLFGSKDENNESTTEEIKNADEPKKEEPSEAEKAASSDHYAPYNIDSDSETYDTEALSIMDINDIIGVQADTGGDSTLESEFAALSEIITDSKDEYAILEEDSAIPDQSLANPADTGQKENTNDSDAEVISKGDGTDRAESPAEGGNINKSLQLIGEAYISEDSRETEVEDATESAAKKSERSREPDGNSIPLDAPVHNEVTEKPGEEEVAESGSKSTVTTDTSEGGNSEVCDDLSGTNLQSSQESSGDRAVMESADSPDAAIIPEPEKPEEVEMMDVDSTGLSDPREKVASPIESVVESGEKEGSNNACAEEVKVPISLINEEATLTNEPEIAEEPMEVDEPHEVLKNSIISDAAPSDIKNDGESSTPDALLISRVQPEVGEGSLKASGDIVESATRAESVTEDSRTILELEKPLEEKCNVEQPESPKDEKIDSKQLNDTETLDPIAENEPNTAKDATITELMPEENLTKISDEPIEEPRVEGVEEHSATQDHAAVLSLENREVDSKVDSTSSKDIEKVEDVKEEAPQKPEVASEPMEIDEPEEQENISKNSPREIEPTSDCNPEDKMDDVRGQETSNSTTKLLEPLAIPDSGESKIPCDSNADENSTDNSIPAVKSCVESSQVLVHSTKSPVVQETVETKISCSDSNTGEKFADNSTPGEKSTDDSTSGIKLSEESFAVTAVEPVRSMNDAKESLVMADEDEKMEVDGSKEKSAQEKTEVTQPCTSPCDIREPTKKEEIREDTIEDEPSIDTVDDAPIAPEVQQAVPIHEKSVSSDTDVGRKIDPAQCPDEVIEKTEVSEVNTHETVQEKEPILVEDTKISERLNENSEEKGTGRTEEESKTSKHENIVTAEEENLISGGENNSVQNENIAEEMKNTSEEHEKTEENADITEQKENAKLDKEEAPQISSSLSQLATSENCPLEKANSPCGDVHPNPMESDKNEVEENQTKIDDTSDSLEKIETQQETGKNETQQETEKVEADSKMAVDDEEILIPSLHTESSDKESQNSEPENQVEVANLISKDIEIRSPDESVSEKKEDSSVSAVPEAEEMEICKETAQVPSESREANVTSIEQATSFSVKTNVRSEETESLADDLDLSVSPEPAEVSNVEEKVKSIPPEKIESSKPAEEATPTSEASSNMQTEERSIESTDSLNDRTTEDPNLPNVDVSNQELEEATVSLEETQISHQNLAESAILSEKDSRSRNEKTNDSTSSMEPIESPSGEEKLAVTESAKNENEQSRNTEEKQSHETEENLISVISETLSTEMQQDATAETVESLCEVVKDSSITVEKVEDSMEVEEKSDSPATNKNETEVAKSPGQNRDENAGSEDCEPASSLVVEGTVNETEITDSEEKYPLDGKPIEESTISTESPAFEANDQCNEDMELSIVTAPLENQEVLNEGDSRERDTLEHSYEDLDMADENKTVTETISVDSDKKSTETNPEQLDDSPKEPSAYKSEETFEEPREKCTVDSEDNLKDILSSDSVCVTQMFQDDEQSQSTQEMMESILETDKGNINNILDEQEVNDLEQTSAFNGIEKLSKESDNMLNKALEDPMTATNIDSLEGLLDLDLIPETDETNLKSVEPIVDKVMQESCDDIGTIDKDVDVALLLEENNTINNPESSVYNNDIATKIMDDTQKITTTVDELMVKSSIQGDRELKENDDLTEKDLEAFDLASVVTNPLDNVDPSEDTTINLGEDLLREIAVDEERKIELTEKLLLDDDIQERDLLLSTTVVEPTKIEMSDEVFLPVETERDMELSEDISLDSTVRDQVLSDVAAEMENLPQNSEISELESAVKFLQESEEQDIDSSLVLSPKMVEDVVDDIVENSGVGIFTNEADICEDHSELVAELESIIPDPIAISEAEIINEAAKLEIERKTKLTEASKLSSPIAAKVELAAEEIARSKLSLVASTASIVITEEPPYPEDSPETRTVIAKSPEVEKIEREPLKKSAPIPKISILEERLKIPPKIEIPASEPTRMCELPTTPKTSLLIQRDVRATNLTKQLESPKSTEKRDELRIVDTPRKDSEKHDFENVGSPRIILKIAKSAIADCSEPRSPKSPKIRSATNSPNPEDSPGQKLGKIKLKLSKGGHPSIISNDNFEEQCGQWHTEGSSSLSPLGMKIKFSKISDSSGSQVDKHEIEETREQTTSKHKFEEAKRTDSPLGMKIKLSRTGEPSIVQQEAKDSAIKHKEKFDAQQGSPKRTESSIGMKIKLSKSGDASIIQPDKQETGDEHKDTSTKIKEKLEATQQQQQHAEKNDTPRRTESPLGMKFKLFKTGDASIVPSESSEDGQQDVKRTDSPLGKKAKPMKTRSATSAANFEVNEDTKEKLEIPEAPRRTESPLGMKIKLSKRGGDASIIHNDEARETPKPRPEVVQEAVQEGTSSPKVKGGKSSAIQPEVAHETESIPETPKRSDATIGMKIKLLKSGDASIVHPDRDENSERSESHQENVRKNDTSLGVKIKLLRSGDASIIQAQSSKKPDDQLPSVESREGENSRANESPTARTKFSKSAEGGTVETSEKKDKSSRRKETEMPIEMKIKLSRTGHPTIVACDNYSETQRGKESGLEITSPVGTSKQSSPRENTGMKILKSMHAAANIHGNRSELTIEPIQLQTRKSNEFVDDSVAKRKDITISPIESKKAKHDTKLSHILPEVTIQPIVPRDTAKQQIVLEKKAGSISRQQMNVISQEISITQVRSNKPMDLSMTDKLKSILTHNPPPPSSDCEIIEHRPELIIVNENSNSSQDVMIIEEVPAIRGPENKVPKKRGRPRRNPLPIILAKPTPINSPATPIIEPIMPRDPLALDDVAHMVSHMGPQVFPPVQTETHGRPKRTCRNQKSYAPPRRGRGRGGRGKRKMDASAELPKRPRIDQDLDLIERSTTALITIHEPPPELTHSANESPPDPSRNTSELYKALRQPTMDRKMPNAIARNEVEQAVNETRNKPDQMTRDHLESLMDARIMSHLDGVMNTSIGKTSCDESFDKERKLLIVDISGSDKQIPVELIPRVEEKVQLSTSLDEKSMEKIDNETKTNKDSASTMDHENWLAPSSKKQCDGRNEANISNVQVMDEETRMSAESGSRSQTPAKNMSVQASETIVNEESQGSVLSTATTESEKVKVKNRRMEIHFDPDEGPFTVDKVAEYDWPLDPTKKNETFMIQEQISHYLGVKSFKRKYPDLKRRMVDMEERNYLRENGLVSEAMCDMGLTAVLSSEVLDIMCSDFPDQYEEYRKHIREKQMKEHFKKQKELTAAANAEKNRIDLAEMAVQSALSWNIGLNKARRESRKCSLDLQTFTIHVPKKQQKVEVEGGSNHYPVALIPGQYTDYYREYTPAELRYYPLNTVLYGPMRPNERKFDSQSEGSQSDSDSDSSSDDSSSSSSEGTQDTEASQSTMDDVDAELCRQKEDIKTIKCKMCLKHLNKFSRTEVLIQCGTCNGYVHPSCIDLTLDMVPHIQAYAWQCTDCKTCAQCHDPADEDKMLFCDMCDRGYHIYCVGLRRVPQGRWHCQECAVCASCGSREAGGTNSDRNSVAQWQHEYKKGDKNTRVYVSTLCVPCSKLWRKGRYCPHCSRCHTVPRLDLEVNLVHCSACDKYLHLGCVETKDLIVDRKNYRCDFCQPLRHDIAKPLVSKVFKT